MTIYTVAIVFGLIALFVFSMFKILREYERGVIFLLGRFWRVKGPGLIIVIPVIQQMVRVDLRTVVMDVPSQDVISRDNVSVKVNAVVYFRVIDPEKAIIQVADFFSATSQLAQTTLRSVLGQHELDEMLAERDKLNDDVRQIRPGHLRLGPPGLVGEPVDWSVKLTSRGSKPLKGEPLNSAVGATGPPPPTAASASTIP